MASIDLVEQFCTYQRKQRGKTQGGVTTYRWNLERFLMFVRRHEGRPARVGDLTVETVQAWMDHMAETDLALSTMRSRQSTLSSLCAWLVKRETLTENPVAKRALLGHTRIDTTQVYATIRPAQLKRAVAFYEDKATRLLSG